MPFPYNPSVPVPNHLPSQDVSDMQTNTASISGLISVDHFGFGDANAGQHQKSTYVIQGSDPAIVPDSAIVYSKNLTTDALTQPEIYVRHPTGSPILLTRGLPDPSLGEGGFYGGLQIRTGSASTPSAVTFSSPFPTACLTVVACPFDTAAQVNITSASLSTTGFTATEGGSPSGTIGYYWIAIGY